VRHQIYLDCDGVLADFDKSATKILGLAPAEFEERHGSGEFWKRLARHGDFFGGLEPMADAYALFDAVKHRKPIILTGMPQGDWAEPQKRRWARRYFPGVPVITTMAALKREHCHPGDVLVDDRPHYRHLWEAEGGVFIQHTDAKSSIRALREAGYI
jgi:hypothetical protein